MRTLPLLVLLAACANTTAPGETNPTLNPTTNPTDPCGEVDRDDDGLGDGCDDCPDDADNDADGDGLCALDDPCPDDAGNDEDEDGLCASEDPCPLDPLDDADGDGVCGDLDQCPGWDDSADEDLDGEPNGCDDCPFDPFNDDDGDGVCGDEDVCPGYDDSVDSDYDGTPDDCDICPFDPLDDNDNDGVCGDVDICPGGDDTVDLDGNGVPDDCEAVGNTLVLTPLTGSLVQDSVGVWADRGYKFTVDSSFAMTGGSWYVNPPAGSTLSLTVYDGITEAPLASSVAVPVIGGEAWYDVPLYFTFSVGGTYTVTFHTSEPGVTTLDRMDSATSGYSIAPYVSNVENCASYSDLPNAAEEYPTYCSNSWWPLMELDI